MQHLISRQERLLGNITLALGVTAWLALIIGTVGGALLGLALAFVVYLFTHSWLIAYVKGNGVRVSHEQFPQLYQQLLECCDRLGLPTAPSMYVLDGGGSLNAFATRFLGHQYVVLLSDVVDAMENHEDGVRFYIGHELGHLRMKHLQGQLLRWPVLWLPLLGAAYSRARETTCDLHGLTCSSQPQAAAQSLAALATGGKQWQALNVDAFAKQTAATSGFWMSFHELKAPYPWLTRRVARVLDSTVRLPARHALAWFLNAFIPYGGRMGGGFTLIIMVYIIGVLAAIAIPQYSVYQDKSYLRGAAADGRNAATAVTAYYLEHEQAPPSLEAAGVRPNVRSDVNLHLDPDTQIVTVSTRLGDLLFIPEMDGEGPQSWSCWAGEGFKAPEALPANCQTE